MSNTRVVGAVVGAVAVGWLAYYIVTKDQLKTEHHLNAGINEILYSGPSVSLPDAMTNVQDKVIIVWYYTPGGWYFYDFTMPIGSNLNGMMSGQEYVIVTSEACEWLY